MQGGWTLRSNGNRTNLLLSWYLNPGHLAPGDPALSSSLEFQAQLSSLKHGMPKPSGNIQQITPSFPLSMQSKMCGNRLPTPNLELRWSLSGILCLNLVQDTVPRKEAHCQTLSTLNINASGVEHKLRREKGLFLLGLTVSRVINIP